MVDKVQTAAPGKAQSAAGLVGYAPLSRTRRPFCRATGLAFSHSMVVETRQSGKCCWQEGPPGADTRWEASSTSRANRLVEEVLAQKLAPDPERDRYDFGHTNAHGVA